MINNMLKLKMYAIFAFPIFEYNDIRQKYGHA